MRSRFSRTRAALLFGVIVLAAGTAWAAYRLYGWARPKYHSFIGEHYVAAMAASRANLLMEGFRVAPVGPEVPETGLLTILFVGHSYPRNGFNGGRKPVYPDRERPMEFLISHAARTRPVRVVFGGDVIWSPSPGELSHARRIKDRMPAARFVMGNHESYWDLTAGRRAELRELFGDPYRFEDVDGVRLIYLHTTLPANVLGRWGLDDEQRAFLKRALDPSQYRHALVFMHHALWAGGTIYANGVYLDADGLAADWVDNIVPLLRESAVRGVFSGDGGLLAPGRRFMIGSIPHFMTGWGGSPELFPPEWLAIELGQDSVRVSWNKLLGGERYRREVD